MTSMGSSACEKGLVGAICCVCHLLHTVQCAPYTATFANLHSHSRREVSGRQSSRRPSHPNDTVASKLVLPSWELEHESFPLCTPDSELSGGKMFETKDGNYVYEPAECRLRRLTADQARQ